MIQSMTAISIASMGKTSRLHAGTLAVLALSTFLHASNAFTAQVCSANTVAMTPTSDFTVHGNGTVTHRKTGLMWKVCSEGQDWSDGSCAGTVTSEAWDAALQIPQSLNSGGGYPSGPDYTDWRLPDLKELKSIAELSCHSPAINETTFPSSAATLYWSSSPSASSGSDAWAVDFSTGNDNNITRSFSVLHVRLVRGGQ